MSSVIREGYRGYVTSRSFFGERAPQHVQNIVIRDYCRRRGFRYLLSATEYAMEDCYLMLQGALDELTSIEGIVLYSLFLLPPRGGTAARDLQSCLRRGCQPARRRREPRYRLEGGRQTI